MLQAATRISTDQMNVAMKLDATEVMLLSTYSTSSLLCKKNQRNNIIDYIANEYLQNLIIS